MIISCSRLGHDGEVTVGIVVAAVVANIASSRLHELVSGGMEGEWVMRDANKMSLELNGRFAPVNIISTAEQREGGWRVL